MVDIFGASRIGLAGKCGPRGIAGPPGKRGKIVKTVVIMRNTFNTAK